MRTKSLLCAAAIAAGAISAMAQNNVYSLNVVGYYNVTVPAGKYYLLANQLVSTNNTVPSLFANVPGGTQVLKWTGVSFAGNTLDPDFGWDDPTMTLVPGEGAFLKNNSANPITVTFVGEVNQNTNKLSFSSGVYKLSSLFTPQAGKLQTDFGFPAGANDQVILWSGVSYAGSTYDPDFGWDAEPEVKVGDGFFVKTATSKDWTRSFTVQ